MERRTAFLLFGFLCAAGITGCGKAREHPASQVIIEGEYRQKGIDNIDFIFSRDSTLKVVQSGVYGFGENSDGEDILKMCFDDTSRELPEDYNYTNYVIESDRRYVYLTLDMAEEDIKPMALRLLKGTEGISEGEPFSGTYQIGGEGNDYQYIFSEDGTVLMEINEYYYIEGEKLTLSDSSGSTDYRYELTEEQITINNLLGETILSLEKK